MLLTVLSTLIKRLGLSFSRSVQDVELGNGSIISSKGTKTAKLTVDDITSDEKLFVLPLSGDVKFVIGRKWLYQHNPNIDWRTAYLRVNRADGSVKIIRPRNAKRICKMVTFKRISIKAMRKLVRKRKAELFAVRVNPKMISRNVSPAFTDLVSEYQDIFKDELPDTLPPHRDLDFEIRLKQDETPPVRPVIRLSSEELQEQRRQLQLLLSKRLIRP